MRAVVATEPGGPEVLVVGEMPDVEAGEGDLVLEVAAAGVNRADTLQRRGLYPPPPGISDVLGLECSGTVAAVGSNVDAVRVGDRVTYNPGLYDSTCERCRAGGDQRTNGQYRDDPRFHQLPPGVIPAHALARARGEHFSLHCLAELSRAAARIFGRFRMKPLPCLGLPEHFTVDKRRDDPCSRM